MACFRAACFHAFSVSIYIFIPEIRALDARTHYFRANETIHFHFKMHWSEFVECRVIVVSGYVRELSEFRTNVSQFNLTWIDESFYNSSRQVDT